jgi:hypothetical protein
VKLIITVALLSAGQFYPQEKQARIKTYWPESVPFPAGLAFYEPTSYAQSTAVTDYPQTGEQNVLTHEWVPARNEAKYSVPGGLLGTRRSEWYSYVGVVKGRYVTNRLVVFPFSGAFGGLLRKKTWEFDAGTAFYDLLVNTDGRTFHLRVREKLPNGTWEPGILYNDRSAHPRGFVEVRGRQCASCHGDAGSAAYGLGVRGSDGVFSFPFKEIVYK